MELHHSDALFIRSLFQIIVIPFVIFKKGSNFWIWEVDFEKNIHEIRLVFVLATMFSGIFNIFDLIAVTYMPIGDAMTIILCSAVPTVILAAIFLGERLRMYKFICTVLVVSGIILVVRPPFLFDDNAKTARLTNKAGANNVTLPTNENSTSHRYYYVGALGAFICMLSISIFRTLNQFLHQNKNAGSSELFLLYHGFWCVIFSLLMSLLGSHQRILFSANFMDQYDVLGWTSLGIFAIIGVTSTYIYLKALKLVGPVVVGFVRTPEIIISYVMEIIIFHTIPYLSSVVGAIFIMIACIGVLLEDKVLACLPPKVRPIF